ncbi:MAG: DUF4129 domain-containing protein [Rhodothermales bacterium]
MTAVRFLLLATLLGLAGLPMAQAQDAATPDVRMDSGRVDVRTLSPEGLQAFRDDPDFAYDRQPPQTDSWWTQLTMWLREKLFAPLQTRAGNRLVVWTFRILAALGLIYAVLKLLRMEPRGLFYGRSDRRRPAFTEIEDLQELDFDQLVSEAVAAEDFRRAVRWLYLGTLKSLAARDLIHWQPEKTNHEYLRELGAQQADLAAPFDRLTYLFEYIWYGDFSVDEAAFLRARERFAAFDQRLSETPAYA